MPALQLQSLFIIVFTESESAKPLGPPEQLPQLQAHCRSVVHRVGHTDTKKIQTLVFGLRAVVSALPVRLNYTAVSVRI